MSLEPQQNPQDEETSFKDRLLAMKLLRENMYLANPERYAITDIAEDLPGSLRPLGDIIKDVLPSRAIISQDPTERKKQIDAALQRIKDSREGKAPLGKEMLENAVSMGKHSIVPSLLLGGLVRLIGGRGSLNPMFTAGYKAKGLAVPEVTGIKKFLPSFKNLGKTFSRKGHWKKMLHGGMEDAFQGAGAAALAGAITPVMGRYGEVSDKALAEARKIMEEQPYITSLPTNEMLSVLKQNKGQDTSGINNALLGAAIGLGSGAIGGVMPSVYRGGGAVLKSLVKGRPLLSGINNRFKKEMLSDIKNTALFGGAIGALGGPGASMIPTEQK
jgi:hypothetical protein